MRNRTRKSLLLIVPLAASVLLAAGSYWLANRPADDSFIAAPAVTGAAHVENAPSAQMTADADHPIAAVGPHDGPPGAN